MNPRSFIKERGFLLRVLNMTKGPLSNDFDSGPLFFIIFLSISCNITNPFAAFDAPDTGEELIHLVHHKSDINAVSRHA